MATTITIGAELPSIPPTVHDDVVTLPSPAYNPAQQSQPTPTLVTMPYMAQTTTNNVIVVERVVQQQPAAQPQIIYVNAQPQQQEENSTSSSAVGLSFAYSTV